MAGLFTPNYGAASSHIAELTAERDDFIEVNRTQAARIRHLEAAIVGLKEDCAAAVEEVGLHKLIAESHARQLEEASRPSSLRGSLRGSPRGRSPRGRSPRGTPRSRSRSRSPN